jgi:arginyl-tRNA synthetase
LARRLRKAPKKIAEEIVAALGSVPGFASLELAGAGYINARLDRGSFAQAFGVSADRLPPPDQPLYSLVEHTSINPNKAAHVGHLRNAILGDTFVRLLKAAGQKVDVQNYVDNTGVQVADVVVGLAASGSAESGRRGEADDGVGRGRRTHRFLLLGFVCAGFAVVRRGAGRSCGPKKTEIDTLHAIEAGGNETAQIAELVSTAVLRRHLVTMLRLGIEYDLLPRESEILHLHFWDAGV